MWMMHSTGRLHGPTERLLVADAGMISKIMIAAVEARSWLYILGARLRRTKLNFEMPTDLTHCFSG